MDAQAEIARLLRAALNEPHDHLEIRNEKWVARFLVERGVTVCRVGGPRGGAVTETEFEQQVAAALVAPLKQAVGDKEGWLAGDFQSVAEGLAPRVAAAIEATIRQMDRETLYSLADGADLRDAELAALNALRGGVADA